MSSKTGEWREDVSIIGVGCTPFGSVLTTPEIKDMTERELFAWAAIEAMEDAGVEAKDIDAFYVGHAMDETLSHAYSSAAMVADWIGMRNKPGYHHESACASTCTGLGLAIFAVASGVYRMVLSGGIEITGSFPKDGKPPHMREPIAGADLSCKTHYNRDQAYSNPAGFTGGSTCDMKAMTYGRKHGLTLEQLADAMDAVVINNRYNGVRNPLAKTYSKELPDEAKERGFKDVKEYMRSRFNPKIGALTRSLHTATPVDGASALIVCPTKIARTLTDHAIDVIGFGSAVSVGYHLVEADWEVDKAVFAQAYKTARIDPYKDIDNLYVHDPYASWQFAVAETAGYFRPGEAWRAVIEGRTTFEGDKPMSTSGGRTTMGHAWAASAGAEIAEAVRQMRGLCGARQIKRVPEVSVVYSIGGGQSTSGCVLRTHS